MTVKKTLLAPLAALIITAITLTALTAAVLSTQQTIPANGSIQIDNNDDDDNNVVTTVDLDVYTDAQATTKCTNINWGTLNPGDTATKTIYIKNTGNVAQILSMGANSWSPESASSVLTLTWNKEDYNLAAGAIVSATLTLQVAPQTGSLSTFSLNIVISGTA
ncbi:MAG: hypothetical protein PHC63_08845 [Candidatus Bathyarchaeota archaeon]|nr:hypothetical protein [Candidatus Bathyarchaeota archaeon]